MEGESGNLFLDFINITIEKESNEAQQFLLQNFSAPHKIQLRKLIEVMNEFHSCKKIIRSFQQTTVKYETQINELKRQLHQLRSQQFAQKFGKQKKRYQILLYLQKGDHQGAISKAKEIKSKSFELIAEHLNQYDQLRRIAKERLENFDFPKILKFVKSNVEYTRSINSKLIEYYSSIFGSESQCDLSTPYFSTKCKELLIQLKFYVRNYRLITQAQETSNRNTLIQLCNQKDLTIKNYFESFSNMFKDIAPFLGNGKSLKQNISEGEKLSATAPQFDSPAIEGLENINKIERNKQRTCEKCQLLRKDLQLSDEMARIEKANRETLTKSFKKIEKASFIFENVQPFEDQQRESSKQFKKEESQWNSKYLDSLKKIQELQDKNLQLQKLIKQNIHKKTIYQESGEEVQQMSYEAVENINEQTGIRLFRQFAMAGDLIAEIEKVQDPKTKRLVKQLEKNILRLQKISAQRQQKYQAEKSSMAKDIERIQRENRQLKDQNDNLKEQIQVAPKSPFLFPIGFIFKQEDMAQRNFLLKILGLNVGQIKGTRLLYRADILNNVNFHRYIDGFRDIVFIAKTVTGRIIAAYSAAAFISKGTQKDFGLLLSLSNQKYFTIKDKKTITYDDFFIIFGNSQLRLKTQQFKLFSNFGIPNGYFDNKGQKVNTLLGMDKEREIDLVEYEFYQLILG